VAALLRRVRYAQAKVDGPGRSATCHRYAAQLPLLRARLYPSRRRRPESANRWLRQLGIHQKSCGMLNVDGYYGMPKQVTDRTRDWSTTRLA
jgi:hypothetical protein